MLDRLMGVVAGCCEWSDKSVLILNSSENFLANRVPASFLNKNLIHGVSYSYLGTSGDIYHTDKKNWVLFRCFCDFLNSLTTENNYVSLPIS